MSHRVDTRAAVVFGGRHLGRHLAAHLQAVQRGVQRSLAGFQTVFRDLLQPVGDPPAVVRTKFQDAQDQEIQRALEQLRLVHGHPATSRDSRGV